MTRIAEGISAVFAAAEKFENERDRRELRFALSKILARALREVWAKEEEVIPPPARARNLRFEFRADGECAGYYGSGAPDFREVSRTGGPFSPPVRAEEFVPALAGAIEKEGAEIHIRPWEVTIEW